jgi:hypothetical protein
MTSVEVLEEVVERVFQVPSYLKSEIKKCTMNTTNKRSINLHYNPSLCYDLNILKVQAERDGRNAVQTDEGEARDIVKEAMQLGKDNRGMNGQLCLENTYKKHENLPDVVFPTSRWQRDQPKPP